MGCGDGAECRSGQSARADREAERNARGGTRAAGQVILAELDQDGERNTYRDACCQRGSQGGSGTGTYPQRDHCGDGRSVARQDRPGEPEPVGEPATEEGAGDASGEEARQRHPGHRTARVQVGDPVELNEGTGAEEVY